jgi:hypothetical protein
MQKSYSKKLNIVLPQRRETKKDSGRFTSFLIFYLLSSRDEGSFGEHGALLDDLLVADLELQGELRMVL